MDITDTKNWEKQYDLGLAIDCPHCGGEDQAHTCRHCYSDIDKKICWEYDGYCTKCFDYVENEIPRIEDIKQKLGVKCQCMSSVCGKCLSVNCKDKNCPVHTKEKKEAWRKRWERVNKKPFHYPKNY